jgi:hypothetical protein
MVFSTCNVLIGFFWSNEKIGGDMYKLNSLKLAVFIVYAVLSVMFMESGKFSGSEFIEFNKYLIGFYFTANVASKFFRNR